MQTTAKWFILEVRERWLGQLGLWREVVCRRRTIHVTSVDQTAQGLNLIAGQGADLPVALGCNSPLMVLSGFHEGAATGLGAFERLSAT